MQSTLGEFQETASQEAFALQNSKLLKVNLQQITIQAKLGSMVAYQGDVSFEHAGSGGMSRLVKKAVTGEGASLMKISGTGEVFLGGPGAGHPPDQARERPDHVQRREPARVRRRHRLGHQAREGRQRDRRRPVQHGALRAPAGWRSSRTARRSSCRRATRRPMPTRQAAITWASSVQTSIKTDVNLKTLIGTRLRRDRADGVLRPGLGARPAERGPRPGAAAGGGGGGLLEQPDRLASASFGGLPTFYATWGGRSPAHPGPGRRPGAAGRRLGAS